MLQLAEHMPSAVSVVQERWGVAPRAAIVLGSGLAELGDQIDASACLDYALLPGFPQTTALGHKAQLVCGHLEGVPVVAFQGRFHLYEGYSPQQAALPVRLAKALGAELLVVSNAAGGLNPRFQIGDVMLIDDQINFMFANPLVGMNNDRWGPRFPDMSCPYDAQLADVALQVARQENFTLHRGVYLAMLGPTYETRAEYRMARLLGGDVVGMSTVPEVLAAVHAGMRVLGLSTVTNIGSPDAPTGTSGHHVIAAAAAASDKLSHIVRGVMQHLGEANH